MRAVLAAAFGGLLVCDVDAFAGVAANGALRRASPPALRMRMQMGSEVCVCVSVIVILIALCYSSVQSL